MSACAKNGRGTEMTDPEPGGQSSRAHRNQLARGYNKRKGRLRMRRNKITKSSTVPEEQSDRRRGFQPTFIMKNHVFSRERQLNQASRARRIVFVLA
jgi:hypothetical protein